LAAWKLEADGGFADQTRRGIEIQRIKGFATKIAEPFVFSVCHESETLKTSI
jgi:hypothetical protein